MLSKKQLKDVQQDSFSDTQIETAKRKAKEIVDKHYWLFGDGYLGKQHIQHAVFEVEGILTALAKQNPNFEDNTYWSPIDFWKQVKEQINQL